MYKKILELTEEIETVSAGDDHVRLEELLRRRAAAFAALESAQRQALPEEAMAIIVQIQECERRCREQATRRLAELKEELARIRKGKQVQKAYGQFAGGI